MSMPRLLATSRGGVPGLRSFRAERILASVMTRLRPLLLFACCLEACLRALDQGRDRSFAVLRRLRADTSRVRNLMATVER